MNQDFDIIIVGAGITGLTAAWQAAKKNQKVCLIDANPLGGLIKTKFIDGFCLEQGPNVFLAKEPFFGFIKQLGMESEVIYPKIENYKQQIYFNDSVVTVPKKPQELLASPILTFYKKLKLFYKIFSKPKFNLKDDCSAQEFFSKLLMPEIAQNVVGPMLRGIFGGEVSSLSARAIFPRLWQHVSAKKSLFNLLKQSKGKIKPKVFVFKKGNFSLIERLAELIAGKVKIIKSKVVSLQKNDCGFEISLANGDKFSSKQVFIATSGSATGAYLHPIAADLAKDLNSIQYCPITVLHAEVDSLPSQFKDSFGVLFPSKLTNQANENILMGVMFNSQLFPHISSSGNHLLTICLGGVGRDLSQSSDYQIYQNVFSEIKSLLKIDGLKFLALQRWDKAIPQYQVGYHEIANKMLEVEKNFVGLKFLGADIGGVGVPDRVNYVLAQLKDQNE